MNTSFPRRHSYDDQTPHKCGQVIKFLGRCPKEMVVYTHKDIYQPVHNKSADKFKN